MKDTVWKLFEKTGNPAYYMLYRQLDENGHKHESDNPDER